MLLYLYVATLNLRLKTLNHESIIIYCYRKIWEEIRNLINTPRMIISLREEVAMPLPLAPSHQQRKARQSPQRRPPLTKLRRRRRMRMMIHIPHRWRMNAAAASAFAPPSSLLVQHAADVSQSSAEPSLLESSVLLSQQSSSFGTTSCSWTNISTGGTRWSALFASFHCLLAPVSPSHGSLRTPEPQDFFYGMLSSFLWSLYHFSALGKWSTSSICTRDQISIKDKAILTHTLTPRSTRKTTFSSCFSRV